MNALHSFFNESTIEEIESKYPYIDFESPGMPPVGPNFMLAGSVYGDTLQGKKFTTYPEWTNAIYRSTLYHFKQNLNLQLGNTFQPVTFVPGHIWKDKSSGPISTSDVMVVGKHPGKEELITQRNFTGVTSSILVEALLEVGFKKQTYLNWYVTNLIKFPRPYEDKTSKTLPVAWIKDCLPLLFNEIYFVEPKYIICLGADAAKTIISKSVKVTEAVGQIFELTFNIKDKSINTKVICCIHPAEVYRSRDKMPFLIGSLKSFYNLYSGKITSNVEEDIDHRVITTDEELLNLTDEILNETKLGAQIALDCEWHGDYPWDKNAYLRLVQISHKSKFAAAILIKRQGGKVNPDINQDIVRSCLTKLLKSTKDRHVRLIGHNLKADLPWLLYHGVNCIEEYQAPSSTDEVEGWVLTKTKGGFDTLAAVHALSETGPFKLEAVGNHYLGLHRYDVPLQQWKAQYCKERDIAIKSLEGYGDCPDEILIPYGNYDVDLTRRLFDLFNGTDSEVGLLDYDHYKNSSREAFYISQRALPTLLEMEMEGLKVNRENIKYLSNIFQEAKQNKLLELQNDLNWSDFNPNSVYHRREFLFGEELTGKVDKLTKEPVSVRPEEALSLYLTPIKDTDNKPWTGKGNPSTDKETLGILSTSNSLIGKFRDLNFINQALKTVLRPPEFVELDSGEIEEVYEKGLMYYVSEIDDRVRTHFYPIETGRLSSSSPNLQNFSSRREDDYKRILGDKYKFKTRNIFEANENTLLIDADFIGAELAILAWMSNDPVMTDHVTRANLPESDPNHYDIHSNVAKESFNLNCNPTKSSLEKAGFKGLRIAAKTIAFGTFYGRGVEAICRTIKEEGFDIPLEDADKIKAQFFRKYTHVLPYSISCQQRVDNPGWIKNCFGRYRRFRPTNDNQIRAELARQAANFTIQSACADAMSTALANIYEYRNKHKMKFKILLSVHDSVLLEAPLDEVEFIYKTVLPLCMSKQNPLFSCLPDGTIIDFTPHYLGIDIDICKCWGKKLNRDELKSLNISI